MNVKSYLSYDIKSNFETRTVGLRQWAQHNALNKKGMSVLATILDKPIFRYTHYFDESSPYMKLGRNWVINELVRVSSLHMQTDRRRPF